LDAERAVARGRALDLLASLFDEGPSRLDHLRAVDALAPFVPAAFDDAAQARHHELLRRQVLPYESVFVSRDRTLGGGPTSVIWDGLLAAGFVPDGEPDHLATQLRFLAWMCGAEADAWRDDRPDEAARVVKVAADFHARHLGRWLVPFAVAMGQVDDRLYGAATTLLLELCMPAQPELLEAEDLVGQKHTGLKAIAEWLATPARSGVWLTGAAITRLARSLELPRGFGRRPEQIENLLHTAVRHGALSGLLVGLDALLSQQQLRSESLGGEVWAQRIEHTRGQLGVIAAVA
jgi:hypothetical protein